MCWKLKKYTESQKLRPVNTVAIYEKILGFVVKEQSMNCCYRNNIVLLEELGFRHNIAMIFYCNICNEWSSRDVYNVVKWPFRISGEPLKFLIGNY